MVVVAGCATSRVDLADEASPVEGRVADADAPVVEPSEPSGVAGDLTPATSSEAAATRELFREVVDKKGAAAFGRRVLFSPMKRPGVVLPKGDNVLVATFSRGTSNSLIACIQPVEGKESTFVMRIDSNGNQDFTDDSALELPFPTSDQTLKIPSGEQEETYSYRLRQIKYGKRQYVELYLTPDRYMEAVYNIDGAELLVRAFDTNGSGSIDASDTCLIDSDLNGSLDPRSESVFLRAPNMVLVAGKVYMASLSDDGTRMLVNPYSGPTADVSLALLEVSGSPPKKITLSAYTTKGSAIKANIESQDATLTLPCATYRSVSAQVSTDGAAYSVRASNVDLKGPFTLDARGLKVKADVKLNGRRLSVNRKFACPYGIQYAPPRGKKRPKVEVYRTTDLSEPILSGSLSYG
jgi:hypothetical protein